MEKKYFYGNEISDYGLENGYVDYAAFAKSFDAVLNNDIISKVEDFEPVSNFMDECADVFQWYIVDGSALEILEQNCEIVYYSYELDMYLWGVTHYGTSWAYTLTDIKIDW